MILYLEMLETQTERSKFELIYNQYKNIMYATAFSILRNEQDAEDAVHQAFVAIIKNISKISDPVCPKTKGYVVTIVENTAINLYRKKKRHSVILLQEEADGITIEYNGDNELARCIAQLPARYRQVLLLKHYHGYTVPEIAKMLSLSVANVRKIEQRAKAKLEMLCKEAQIL